jgi:hypothetical protein
MTPEERVAIRLASGRLRSAKYRAANRGKVLASLKAYRAVHLEEERARNKAYRSAHQEQAAARDKAYAAAHQTERRASLQAYKAAHKEGLRLSAQQHRAAHLDEMRARCRSYQASHAVKVAARKSAYRIANPELTRASYTAWARSNRAHLAARTRGREADKLKAMPAWANQRAMEAMYEAARRLTLATGIQYDVDHIFPLKGKTVCGLHVESNLQIMTHADNIRKHNKFPCEVAA